ncbi:MAG: PEP/pyruvate-binding domain-containing protein [Candidatus Micrarchaeota archaeon]
MAQLAIRRIQPHDLPDSSFGGKAFGMRKLAVWLPDLQNAVGKVNPSASVFVPATIEIPVEGCRSFILGHQKVLRSLRDAKDDELFSIMQSHKLSAVTGLSWLLNGLKAELAQDPFANASALAIRSSAIGEDSAKDPRAGIYSTVSMALPQGTPKDRLKAVLDGVKGVWASFFSQLARTYVGNEHEIWTPGEGGMGVIIQPIVGSRFSTDGAQFFAPHCAGQFCSVDPYIKLFSNPVVSLVFGHGTTVVDGEVIPQTLHLVDKTGNNQEGIDQPFARAIDLSVVDGSDALRRIHLMGNLRTILSQDPGFELALEYSSPKLGKAPYVNIKRLLSLGIEGVLFAIHNKLRSFMDGSVDVEFALMSGKEPGNWEIHLVQVRRDVTVDASSQMVLPAESGAIESSVFVGHGINEGIRKIVVLDENTIPNQQFWDSLRKLNELASGDGALLITSGIAGTSNPKLGIPFNFTHVSHFSCILEGKRNGKVIASSPATHFLRGLISKKIVFGCVDGDRGAVDLEQIKQSSSHIERVGQYITVYTLEIPATLYANKNLEFGPVRLSLQL